MTGLTITMNGAHRYSVSGPAILEAGQEPGFRPGVSGVLSAGLGGEEYLQSWAGRMAAEYLFGLDLDLRQVSPATRPEIVTTAGRAFEAVRDKSRDIGTELHAAACAFFRGDYYDLGAMTPEARHCYGMFLDWTRESGFTPMGAEEMIYNFDAQYCGTVDAFGKIGKQIVVPDFKTGKSIGFKEGVQVAAYIHGLVSMKLIPRVCPGLIVHLPKEGDAPVPLEIPVEDIENLYKVFLNCRGTYDWKSHYEKTLFKREGKWKRKVK